ncbi:hypothetical protein [Deinococcus arenae]|uniref:hypothetical protein n=1 Tax=Deinococcus arenae TaxID=1452751 RepID=UPI00166A0365|nr:hypothetical protein [Deinococcus arenae]
MDEIRDRVRGRLVGNADLLYRHEGTFTKTQNGREFSYSCRFSVRDLTKGNRDQIAAANAFAADEGAAFRDIRLLRIHPDDPRPPEGAVLAVPWDGGRLEVRGWSQSSDFTGQAVGFCILRR